MMLKKKKKVKHGVAVQVLGWVTIQEFAQFLYYGEIVYDTIIS